MSDGEDQNGGCLCGKVRFAFTGTALWTAHCHCRSCRRNTGAAVATFVGVGEKSFRWAGTSPQVFESSRGVYRSFCATCGGALTYVADRYPGEVHINIGALDHPEAFVPKVHVWTEEALPWLHIGDNAPRHARTVRAP